MTNRELQDQLKQYPDDMPVTVNEAETDDDYDIDCVRIGTVIDENGTPHAELIIHI